MLRKTAQLFAGVALFALLILCARYTASAQAPAPKSDAAGEKKHAAHMSNAQKIALAVSAGPVAITKAAAIFDMTDMAAPPKELRAGTNGWACYAMINTPMCLDKEWQKWADAWMGKKQLQITSTGIAYMLRGDNGASNTDPYAMAPAPGNQWVVTPAHVMVIYADSKMLDAYPTDPKTGGPWVMWKGTPYAHVMVPVAPLKTATVSSK